ncbi:MAG: Type 1 glutamine amidotransferase-like domain-containing protein [Oscillospiraceae bacterium]|nr:Type 1 glutamine amidotransferase-like domain-containing protein [Oscillospiraceae bacterium]
MICFLTSTTVLPENSGLNPANRFVDELHEHFPSPCRALFICSDPDSRDITDFYTNATKAEFEKAGFPIDDIRPLDSRNEEQAAVLVRESDLIFLAGGHVPTQNRFFHKIGLCDLLKDYHGIIIGISAGSMNSAEIVYSRPEKKGEAIDPDYQRFLKGLNLTKANLLPHYQENKDHILDGLRIYEDIAYPDSMGRTFYAIPDGSYLFIDERKEELRGETYMISGGIFKKISSDGETVVLR